MDKVWWAEGGLFIPLRTLNPDKGPVSGTFKPPKREVKGPFSVLLLLALSVRRWCASELAMCF